jgi:hypothetical protein
LGRYARAPHLDAGRPGDGSNVKVGDAQQVGPNSGLLSLLGRDQTLRKARLLITGVN